MCNFGTDLIRAPLFDCLACVLLDLLGSLGKVGRGDEAHLDVISFLQSCAEDEGRTLKVELVSDDFHPGGSSKDN
jgi:hypothetical protein